MINGDKTVSSKNNLNVTYRADLFDGILATMEYEGQQVDVFSIKLFSNKFNSGAVIKHWKDNCNSWQVTNYCPVDVEQFMDAVEHDPYITRLLKSNLSDLSEFVLCLGIELNFESILFFSSVRQWTKVDYPKIYLLLLWHHRQNLPPQYEYAQLTGTLLSQAVGQKLSKSQLKNLRKLDVDNVDVEFLMRAASIIIENFEYISDFVQHEKKINPASLIAAWDAPHLLRVRCLLPLMRENRYAEIINEIWPLLTSTCELGVQLGKVVNYDYEQFYTKTVSSIEHLQVLNERWRKEYEQRQKGKTIETLGGDMHFPYTSCHHYLTSSLPCEDLRFPHTPLLESNTFKRISTSRELMAISDELDNCAANYVYEAMEGESAYFRYQLQGNKEVALLEVTVDYDKKKGCLSYTIDNFLAYSNSEVSSLAKSELERWVDLQNIEVKDI